MYTYPGNIHIHSRYSDGSGDVRTIAAAAAAAKLNFIIITDHETLQGLPEEDFYGGVAVLVGVELNRTRNHYLALGLSDLPERNEARPQELIDAVRSRNGLGFIAHPFEKGSPYVEGGAAYPWNFWPVFRFTGLELWNYSSHWRGRATSIPRSLYWFILNRKGAMDGPPGECLRLWDCYTDWGHRVTAIGGTDAHAVRLKIGFIPVAVFPYKFLFKTINTYICLEEPLSREFTRAKEQVYSALGRGCCYISFDGLHTGRGFSFSAFSDGKEIPMGAETTFIPPVTLQVISPVPRTLIRLVKNGRVICRERGQTLRYRAATPGVYRAEAYYRPLLGRARPWIYSNPIYIGNSILTANSHFTCRA